MLVLFIYFWVSLQMVVSFYGDYCGRCGQNMFLPSMLFIGSIWVLVGVVWLLHRHFGACNGLCAYSLVHVVDITKLYL